MTTYTLEPRLTYRVGQRILVYRDTGFSALGTVERVEGHEIRVHVGGRLETLPFQQHDGPEWTYHEVEGDEPGPEPEHPLFEES
jgi:hypothetical protein